MQPQDEITWIGFTEVATHLKISSVHARNSHKGKTYPFDDKCLRTRIKPASKLREIQFVESDVLRFVEAEAIKLFMAGEGVKE